MLRLFEMAGVPRDPRGEREPLGVEVWTVRVAGIDEHRLAEYREWLAPGERAAVDRHAGEAKQREYLVTRALSRWVLSRYEPSVSPGGWELDRTAEGRPFVVGPRPAPCFNLSNADGLVVCAASRHRVGVDVEPLARGPELVETASRLFSERESADLLLLRAEERPRRAVELWTLKEAYLKARGQGITVRLTRFTIVPDHPAVVGLNNPSRYRLLDAGPLQEDAEAWQLDVQTFGDAWMIAAAVERPHLAGARIPITVAAVIPAWPLEEPFRVSS